jgi:hypothetical protein
MTFRSEPPLGFECAESVLLSFCLLFGRKKDEQVDKDQKEKGLELLHSLKDARKKDDTWKVLE